MCCCNGGCRYGRVFCSTNFFFLSLRPLQFVYNLGFISCFFNRKMRFLILYAENMDARSRIQHGSSISFVPYQIFSCGPQNDHLHTSLGGGVLSTGVVHTEKSAVLSMGPGNGILSCAVW